MNVSEQYLTFIRNSLYGQAFIKVGSVKVWFLLNSFQKLHYFDIGNLCRCVIELNEHLVVVENGSILSPMLLCYKICVLIEESSGFWGPDLSFVLISWQNDPCKVIKSVGSARIMDCNQELTLVLVIINWAVKNGIILASNTCD